MALGVNTQGRGYGGNTGFRIGDIPSSMGGGRTYSDILGQFNGNFNYQFPALDMGGIESLNQRLASAKTLEENPESAPGFNQTMSSINANLARRAEAEKGQAMSHAAQTGQAGFQGALGQVYGDIVSREGEASAKARSDMMMEIYKQARAEGLSLTEALNQAHMAVNQIETQRGGIQAQLKAQQAELAVKAQQDAYNNLIQQAQLAENARQYNQTQQTQQTQFGKTFGLEQSKFGLEQQQFQQQQTAFQQQMNQQKIQNILNLYQNRLINPQDAMKQLQALGYKGTLGIFPSSIAG